MGGGRDPHLLNVAHRRRDAGGSVDPPLRPVPPRSSNPPVPRSARQQLDITENKTICNCLSTTSRTAGSIRRRVGYS